MTCVAGLADGKTVWIGADSCMSSKERIGQTSQPKVFFKEVGRHEGPSKRMLIGTCGWFRMFQLLEYVWTVPYWSLDYPIEKWLTIDVADSLRTLFRERGFSKSKDGLEEFDGSFLLGFQGRLFHIEENFQFIESASLEDACGTGEQFALGSLYTSRSMLWTPEMRIRMALGAATINPFVSQPFDIWELKND